MSALSIPPSQKTNISVGLESIHNYANVLNPITFVGTDQYSVVAVYTEMESSEVDQDTIESAEVQIQTDFYEEEIVAVSADNAVREEATALRAEETCETVDVAKALETLTKAFALRKESIGHDGSTGKSNNEPGSGNVLALDKTCEGHETSDQTDKRRENIVEEVTADSHPGDMEGIINSCTSLKDQHESISAHEETGASETRQSLCTANVRRSTRLQMKTSPSQQELFKPKRSPRVISEALRSNHSHHNTASASSFQILPLFLILSINALFLFYQEQSRRIWTPLSYRHQRNPQR